MWSSETERARFWLNAATELKNRGLEDVFIWVDELSGFAQARRKHSSLGYQSPDQFEAHSNSLN